MDRTVSVDITHRKTMMEKSVLACALVLAASLPAASQTPALDFLVGGQSVAADVSQQSSGVWTAPTISLGGLTFSNITLEVDADPFVHYSYSVSNTSGASAAYSTSASAPASLAAGDYLVNSSLGVSVTDFSSSPGGVSVGAASGPLQKAYADATEVTTADLGTGTISETTFGATNTQNFSAGPSLYTLVSPISQISTVTSFNLSDAADVGITGFFQITSTPEPSSAGLALIATGAFAALVLRRRARA
jgi:hypothetical protein